MTDFFFNFQMFAGRITYLKARMHFSLVFELKFSEFFYNEGRNRFLKRIEVQADVRLKNF